MAQINSQSLTAVKQQGYDPDLPCVASVCGLNRHMTLPRALS